MCRNLNIAPVQPLGCGRTTENLRGISKKQTPARRIANVIRFAKTRNSFGLWHKNGPQTKNKLMDI